MHIIVVDTNVIVSAMKSVFGKPAKILNMIFDKEIQIYYSIGIMEEYIDVLSRPKLNIKASIQSDIISAIQRFGIMIEPSVSDVPMLDEDDRIFYDAAKEAGAILITGNTKHYPTESFIMTSM